MSDRNSTMTGLSRREFLKKSAGAAGGLALAQNSGAEVPNSGSQRRPNFVFVMTDGHRPSALSLAGNPIVKTPNFDRIGREGSQFRESFVINGLCLPSRATALTGLYSHTSGCLDNGEREIAPQIPMFTDLLRAQGYEVALFGKAHVKNLGKRYWDHYFGFSILRPTTFGRRSSRAPAEL